MATVQQLLTDIDDRLPNSFTDTQKVRWMNNCQNRIWRFLASTELYEFDTIADTAVYSLSTSIRFDKISSVQVSNTTVIDGTEGYNLYKFAGYDDELTGSQYYDVLGNIGLYPPPEKTALNVKLFYESAPTQLSTNTLNTEVSLDPEYQDILTFNVLKTICQSGNAPDVELANNYQSEENDIMKQIRLGYYKKKQKNPRSKWNYASGNWEG